MRHAALGDYDRSGDPPYRCPGIAVRDAGCGICAAPVADDGAHSSRNRVYRTWPFQFMAGLRKRHPALHRWTGRIFLCDSLLVGATALVMSPQMAVGGAFEN